MSFVHRLLFVIVLGLVGCSDSKDDTAEPVDMVQPVEMTPVPADEASVFAAANGCYALSLQASGQYLAANSAGASFEWIDTGVEGATQFRFRPTDLGTYLLYAEDGHYLTAAEQVLGRQETLASDTREIDGQVVIEDRMQSEGEWLLQAAENGLFKLQHIQSDLWLSASSQLAPEEETALIELSAQTACAEFPEQAPPGP